MASGSIRRDRLLRLDVGPIQHREVHLAPALAKLGALRGHAGLGRLELRGVVANVLGDLHRPGTSRATGPGNVWRAAAPTRRLKWQGAVSSAVLNCLPFRYRFTTPTVNEINHPPAGPQPRTARAGRQHATRWIWALAVSVLAACGGDGTGTPDPVAAVTLQGVPADIVLAGTTVQLGATTTSASGATLSNRTVTWQSSDLTIATVGATGTVSVVGREA